MRITSGKIKLLIFLKGGKKESNYADHYTTIAHDFSQYFIAVCLESNLDKLRFHIGPRVTQPLLCLNEILFFITKLFCYFNEREVGTHSSFWLEIIKCNI